MQVEVCKAGDFASSHGGVLQAKGHCLGHRVGVLLLQLPMHQNFVDVLLRDEWKREKGVRE
jgi:hypothetical protein